MQEVAERAGVSVPTVSRALAGGAGVAADTRRRVERAAAELAYQPDGLARALRGGHTDDVAVVVPFVTNASAVERLRGVVDGLRASDLSLNLFDIERPDDVATQFESVVRRRPAAVIAISVIPSDAQLDRLEEANIPLVLVEGLSPRPAVGTVNIDDREVGRQAAAHLLHLGHERMAFIGDQEDGGFGFVASRERREGFEAALREAGPQVLEPQVRLVDHSRELAREAAAELLLGPAPPTAVFAASDNQALGVIDAARQQGVDVPGQLSVVGCDDVSSSADLGLTTVSVSLHESGVEAARLIHSARPHEPAINVILPVSLRIRQTTGRALH